MIPTSRRVPAQSGRLRSGSLVAALCLGLGLLGTPSSAHAMNCSEVMDLLNLNVPAAVVVDTMSNSGSRFSDEDIQCLKQRGAPGEVIAKAMELKKASAPPPVADDEGDPDEAPSARDAFDSTETLGGDLESLDDEGTGGGGAADLDSYIRDFKAKKYRTASYGLYTLLAENAYPEKDTIIKYYLAKSLQALELYHAAQTYYMEVVKKGPTNPLFKHALPRLAQIATLTGNDVELARIVDKIAPEAYPRQARPHLYYLMGQKAYAADELADASAYFERVPANHELYPRAQYFQGVINFKRDKFKSAAKSFREVIRAEIPTEDPRVVQELEDLKDLSLINIARIYYGLQRYEDADKYYAKVDRDSTYWPQSLFERAWTNFFTGDVNLALGLVATANSPFYADQVFLPDTQYLRALVYFQLCEYPEVERVTKIFQSTYTPMREEMKAFIDTYRSERGREMFDQAYESYFGAKATTDTTLPVALFRSVLRDRELSALVRHMDMMEGELESIAAQTPQWRDTIGDHLGKVLASDMQRYKEKAGRAFLQELLDTYRSLDGLLQDTDVLLFELTDAQRADYMFRANNAEVQAIDEQPIDFATSPEIVYWPFNGEFWRDELAYYRFTERGSCN
ncbi:MAG: hypothetical protein H6732_04595 [Alphaproteobacteria bacterium]|nr:hypothetical protein [Alphaproteobacteria bacterium]